MNYRICPRCNGNGRIEKYSHVDNGICFECSGSGRVTEEEYQRIEKEVVKEIKVRNTKQANFNDSLKKQWFNSADKIYIVDNCNTYAIKDQLKHAEAIYNNIFKVWYFTECKSNFDLFTITWEEVNASNTLAVNMRNIIKEKSKNGLKGF